ncbi:MAG: PDDEXK nuclease domain-containing protein [Candidatus Sulfotelmatobacter sp.]
MDLPSSRGSSEISTDSKDFHVDLIFYNDLLKCFVLFDLKTGELTHQDIGQMDMYVRIYDGQRRSPEDDPTVGIIRCAQKDASAARKCPSLLADRHCQTVWTESRFLGVHRPTD